MLYDVRVRPARYEDEGALWGWMVAGLAACFLVTAFFYYITQPAPVDAPPLAASTVKVIVPGGTGSGVNIGDGYILTAGHVASDLKEVGIKTSTGATTKAAVLWVNTDYDIALMRLETATPMQSSPLSCHQPQAGDRVSASGNPLNLEFVTTHGTVAGNARQYGPWHSVVPVDMVIIQGMSGGPTFNSHGEVVGINVGVMAAPTDAGFGADAGIGYVVPGSAICELLDRR